MVDTALRGRSRRTADRMADAAIRYAAMGWPVCSGAFVPGRGQRSAAAGRACSCDRIGCPSPGAHPISPAWQLQASTDPELVSRWWLAHPEANIVLATGRVFDVLDVPRAVGLTALTRMERSGDPAGPGCGQRRPTGPTFSSAPVALRPTRTNGGRASWTVSQRRWPT